MSLPVVSFAGYLTKPIKNMRQKDYDASKFINAIKGKEFFGYVQIAVHGRRWHITNANRADAFSVFGTWAVPVLREQFYESRIGLIPFPSSKTTEWEDTDFTAYRMAQAVIAEGGRQIEMVDVLRFKEARESSRVTGDRSVESIYNNLVSPYAIRDSIASYLDLVLIDDVFTTGSHLRAAVAELREQHRISTAMALCAGRSVHVPLDAPFDVPTETLPDFYP